MHPSQTLILHTNLLSLDTHSDPHTHRDMHPHRHADSHPHIRTHTCSNILVCTHITIHSHSDTHIHRAPPPQHTYPDPHTHQAQRQVDTQSKGHTEIYNTLGREATVTHSHARTAAQMSTQHTRREAVQGAGDIDREHAGSFQAPSVAPFLPFLLSLHTSPLALAARGDPG